MGGGKSYFSGEVHRKMRPPVGHPALVPELEPVQSEGNPLLWRNTERTDTVQMRN